MTVSVCFWLRMRVIFVSLCCFSAVFVEVGSTAQESVSSLSRNNRNSKGNPSACSFNCEDFRTLENEMRKLKKVVKELKKLIENVNTTTWKELGDLKNEGSGWILEPLQGPPGEKGAVGQKGDVGQIGPEGEKGQMGLMGQMGQMGPAGRPGEKGQMGPAGRPGEKGESGMEGEKGDRGPQGESGRKGDRGQVGPEGKPGRKGGQGISALHFSTTSCSGAMGILPPPRTKNQFIYPHENGNSASLVLCDFETDGGGWTIIQKRSRGPKHQFDQNWNEYVQGFGSLDGNFWLGLDKIHTLTKNGDQELRIEMEDFKGEKKWVKYSRFSISDASDFYRLSISGFSGDAGDSITSTQPGFMSTGLLNGMRFTTKDRDEDESAYNCATHCGGGGWWFKDCSYSNLNGLFYEDGEATSRGQGILWSSWKGFDDFLAKTEMKIRTRK